MQFQLRLNHALKVRNMKPVDLAEKTGISKPRISQYTNGVYVPKSDALFKLADALNVSPEWLRGLNVPMELRPNNPEYPVTPELMKKWEAEEKKPIDELFPLELLRTEYGSKSVELIEIFIDLNDDGQARAVELLEDLVCIEKYRKEQDHEK